MSNSFIKPGEITTLTFLTGHPIDGVGKFGPYRAYKVQTDNRQERMFYAPRYLYADLDALALTRGSVVQFLAMPAETRDGRRYTRIEIAGTGAPRDIAPATAPTETPDTRSGILASVALKSATQTHGVGALPTDVLSTAEVYLRWLRSA
jgi:hypothetical protein